MFSGFRKQINRSLEFFTRSIFKSIMDEEDALLYSHQKLQALIELSSNKNETVKEYVKSVNFPPVKDFQKALEWFNVSEPLSFANHLHGKVVLLDFFTYCCINCMHILPNLRDLENEFSVEDGLVVIGVHSAKFENEKNSKNILAAVQRYGISHPVVNDGEMTMWRNCGVHCWPTLLLLGPKANPIVMLLGEGHKECLRLYIKNILEYYKSRNEISDHKLPFKSAYHFLPETRGSLLFPGKIASYFDTSTSTELLAISDSANHRILLVNSDGTVIQQIGNGSIGYRDGKLEKAEFNSPQGLTFDGKDVIYIADTENHAIRKIDLKSKEVETVAGTGEQGSDFSGGKLGKAQEISSPWDVCVYRKLGEPESKVLIIAMAGTHQIWALFLKDTVWWKNQSYSAGTCVRIAGSGREENRNNDYPHKAAFAQPSGLAVHHGRKEVYIADSESSSIRRLSLENGKVSAVVGGDKNPNNLFAFGDKDGKLQEAKLQHPLGLCLANDSDILFVADTYNHKIKKIDIVSNTSTTFPIPGLNEPGGLTCSTDGKKLYVADTNNHCVKTVELDDRLSIIDVKQLQLEMEEQRAAETPGSNLPTYNNRALAINSNGGNLKMKINLNCVNGLKLSPEAPQKWSVLSPAAAWSIAPNSGNNLNMIDIMCKIPAPKADSNYLDCVFNLVTCTESSCVPKKFIVRQPLTFSKDAPSSLESTINVELNPGQVLLRG